MDAQVKVRPTVSVADMPGLVGREIGVSDWILVDQGRIDAFADATEDWQFIHVDPVAAADTPFGGTIAHGFLTLSLLARMGQTGVPRLDGTAMGINYGFDKVRFLQPVRSGRRVRGRFKLAEASEKDAGRWLIRYAVSVEIEGEPKPALMADWLTMQMVGR
jgi:acyl dehydratase